MNEKKSTVRDIAQKAGVSVATVSYVLNDKEGAKISDATRKKVLQVANLLNYRIPDKYRNGNDKTDFYSIGVIYALNPNTPSRNIEIMQLINLLAERFSRMNYRFQLQPIAANLTSYEPIHGLDGIIAIDLCEHDFKMISGNYYIPILCLDMMINDFLFYQIHTDIETLLARASRVIQDDYYLVTEQYYNEKYQAYLASVLPKNHCLIHSGMTAADYKHLKGKHILALGTFLGMELSRELPDARITSITTSDLVNSDEKDSGIHNDLEKKANLATNIMMNALEKKFDVKHEYKIC